MYKRVLFFLIGDSVLSAISLYLSLSLRFNFQIPESFLSDLPVAFVALLLFKVSLLFVYKTYFVIWRLFTLNDIRAIIKAHFFAYSLFAIFILLYGDPYLIPKSVLIIDLFLSLSFLTLFRMSRRLYLERSVTEKINPTLLIGVDEKLHYTIQKARKGKLPYHPVAILNIDEKKFENSYISGIRVYHRDEVERVINSYGIKSAIIVSELDHDQLNQIFDEIAGLGVKDIKSLSTFSNRIENISIEDLLARNPKDLDLKAVEESIRGKRVLITGAGGSIGSELSKQVESFGAEELLLVDHSEFNLYRIDSELQKRNHKNYLIDIKNRDRVEEIFKSNRIDLVLHSAAYKHVPLCEENIESAVENNIIGSKNVIDLSIENRVPKVVIISTDKAVRPTNVMGTTKRIVELYAQNVDSRDTEIGAVRFGNVLGSSGSVIPKFRELIEKNQPITVTDPEITRYFMLISEACQLVLQAGTLAKSGEIFILDMGKPVKIVDLAKRMLKLYGKESLPIEFIGLRKGEKRFEELLISDAEMKTKYESIFVTAPTDYSAKKLQTDIDELINSDSEEQLKILKRVVPEFKHNR
jgi:UDP-N-acetyl-D-glucosamine 4,6-dehydratase